MSPSGGGPGGDLFHGPARGSARRARALEPLAGDAFTGLVADEHMGKGSIVGAGMRSHPGVAAKVFSALAKEGIYIDLISTSPI